MKKVIYSTVMYSCDDFDIFVMDYLKSVFIQTNQNFELLLILDNISIEKVKEYVDKFNKVNKKIYIKNFTKNFTPIELRKKQIDMAYELDSDILILSDFDENVTANRVEEVVKNIDGYAFAFNDFYIVDKNLIKLNDKSFFETREIPNKITSHKEILSFNFIGLGSMALNLMEFDYKSLEFPKDIKALDWYIASRVLLTDCKGIKLDNTYANYRQHESSFVGFDFKLNNERLEQGLNVKLIHYNNLKKFNDKFYDLYNEIAELKTFIQNLGQDEYINLINEKYEISKFCWWENIKTKKELGI